MLADLNAWTNEASFEVLDLQANKCSKKVCVASINTTHFQKFTAIFAMKGPLPNVIVTCTARKTLPVSVEVGSLTNTYPDQRFDEWTRKLEPSSSTVKTAKDLYAGSSWSPVREIIDSARANVWIASAGYGLITPATSILSYSATFTRNHPDFVGADDVKNGAQNWWSKLTARNIKREPISSISELVRQNPDIPLIASLSEDYWAALKSDFEEAARIVRSPENMVIVAAGVSEKGNLGGHFLPCSARLERELGRGRSALNVRTLAHILKKYPYLVGKRELFETFQQLLSSLDDYPYPQRSQTSDEQVVEFIRRRKLDCPKVSHSSLLREFRAGGNACEQSRFRELFKQTNPI